MAAYDLLTEAFAGHALYSVATTPDGLAVFVTGAAGYNAISWDYGQTFSAAGAGGTSPKSASAMSDGGTVIHCGDWAGNVYTYHSGSWNSGTNPGSGAGINGLICDPTGQYVWAVLDQNYFAYSTDYGATWTHSTTISNGWAGIARTRDGSKIIISPNGQSGTLQYLRQSTDGGVTLTNITGTAKGNWSDVAISDDGQKIYAAQYGKDIGGAAGPIMKSSNGGTSWAATTAPNDTWVALDCSSDGVVVLAGTEAGLTYLSIDSGTTWTSLGTTTYTTDNDPGFCNVSNSGVYLYSAFINGTAGALLRRALIRTSDFFAFM